MGFRGGSSGGFRGRGSRGGSVGGRTFSTSRGANGSGRSGTGRGGGGKNFDSGPPERVIPFGHFAYTCQDDLICKVDIEDVPYFNAPIFLENKEQIGKVDEIFGTLRDYSISIKLAENMNASSFKNAQRLFIDPQKLLPLLRFLPKPPQPKGAGKKRSGVGNFCGRGGNRGGGRGRGFSFAGKGSGGRNVGGGGRGRGGSGSRFGGGGKGFRGR